MTYPEFLSKITQIGGFYVNDLGRIRRNNEDNFSDCPVSCPITAVCEKEGKGVFTTGQVRHAAQELELAPYDTERVIAAADAFYADKIVRRELLVACKLPIPSERSTANAHA